jgi:hypothetical protein
VAKTVCLACDQTYGDSLKQCPHCFTTNFFSHEDNVVVNSAIHVLIEDINHQRDKAAQEKERNRQETLAELRNIHRLLVPKPVWYVRLWRFLTRKAA